MRLQLAATIAVLSTGCFMVEIDAEIRSSCTTKHDLAIEAVPAGLIAPGEVDLEIELALTQLEWLDDLDAELRFTQVRLSPTSGIDALDFVEAARVTVASADPDAALPTLTVVACSGGDCPRDAVDLLLRSDLEADVTAYASTGTVIVNATIGGALPSVPWVMELEVCTEGSASTSL